MALGLGHLVIFLTINLCAMKKYIIFCLLSIISTNMLAQVYLIKNKYENIPPNILSDIDKMGVDDDVFLTELEGKYFNAISGISEKEFNFYGKKVAFFTGNIGSIKSDKKKYFTGERAGLKTIDYSCSIFFGFLYIFDAVQKEKSGGYDAAIVYGSKKKNSMKEVVKRLKKT
jgi:hypothetical protein